MNKSDRRVRRTKKLLKDSLAKLLLEKELNNISVSELTELADVSRGAFYTHYQDIYDLYESLENDFVEDISSMIFEDPSDEYRKQYERIFDYIKDNADVCRVFIASNRYQDKMESLLVNRYSAIVLYEMHASEMKDEWKYLARYHNGGFIAILRLWIDSNFTYPKEKLLKMLLDIDDACDFLFN